jgi:hypothetical protein
VFPISLFHYNVSSVCSSPLGCVMYYCIMYLRKKFEWLRSSNYYDFFLVSKCLGCVYVQRESRSSDFKGVSGRYKPLMFMCFLPLC